MTDDDLNRIEAELGVTLPADYRSVVGNYPINRNRGTADGVLFDNARSLIERNRQYHDGFAGLPLWPKEYYFIGDDGAASCYFIDLSRECSPVFFANHGSIEDVRTEAPSLKDFVARYLADLRADGIDPDAEPPPTLTLRKVATMALVVAILAGVAGYLISLFMTCDHTRCTHAN